MVAKTVAEERSSESYFQNYLSLYMIILPKFHCLVDTYISVINYIVLEKLGKHVSAVITLTRISILHLLGLALFYIPQL